MSDTATLEQLLDDVANNPSDMGLRLIAADCAEDCGDQYLADCLRWMARNGKYPHHDDSRALASGKWTWWWQNQSTKRPRHATVPFRYEDSPSVRLWYDSSREAEEAFYKDWKQKSLDGSLMLEG